MQLAYRMEAATQEEIAASDPFGGSGLFLPYPGSDEEMLARLKDLAGEVLPAVAFAGRGLWLDMGAGSRPPADIADAWKVLREPPS